jgi:hypothetical protein
MARSIQQLEARIQGAIEPGFRRKILARGLARNLIWSKGVLPADSPPFSPTLSSELLSYGLGLLALGLELRSHDRQNDKAVNAITRAAEAIEAVVRDGNPDSLDRGFYTIIAAASYHLAHFSAKAFSLLPSRDEDFNLSPTEKLLALILTRDFGGLRRSMNERIGIIGPDKSLALELNHINKQIAIEIESENTNAIEQSDDKAVGDFAQRQLDRFLRASLESIYFQALAAFEFSLEAGSEFGISECLRLLDEGIAAAAEYSAVTLWWTFTVSRHLLDDLWSQTLHKRLPVTPSNDTPWDNMRRLFIAKLFKQSRAEIELWPSQLLAATRAIDETDDFVVTLPTSAGKTRIAELCILRALSLHQRIVFVTPLRALSAQTERSIRQTFGPLGFTVSSLYGSSGSVGDDADSLRNRDIVISTPEKLDFALRNDPELLDNVGLIVLDEAHTLGVGEREVRYEVLVQRLLRRSDAAARRIVCLSAILPRGEQLEDFVAWIRQDQEGGAISVDWRPTRQRFGEIFWTGTRAELTFRVEGAEAEDAPYIRSFVAQKAALGKQTKKLPRDRNDLCLLSAWRLIEEGQTVLIYCTERRSVMVLANKVIDLIQRTYLNSLLECDPAKLTEALNIGREWLGQNHPAVQCLRYGIAVHHGHLPRPFLRAVERLLKDQYLKVTISSPTLAQGLNLSATTVLFSRLKRFKTTMKGEEFANVAGRAGRAFVDIEGQVLCVAWEKKHLQEWNRVLQDARVRNIKSGLLQLIMFFSRNMAEKKGYTVDQVLQFVTANAGIWEPPQPALAEIYDDSQDQLAFEHEWSTNLACLDSALLSIIPHDIEVGDVATAIDTALTASLWKRSLLREDDSQANIAKLLLQKRASFIWENSTAIQRKGYFFAGVSFNTGRYLDRHADVLNTLLYDADIAFGNNEVEKALKAVNCFAEIAFAISPFTPDDGLPDNWPDIVKRWILGHPMTDLAGDLDEDVLEFIEDGLVYRLVWAMEAVRVRQSATVSSIEATVSDVDFEGRAALAVETGTTNYCAALLIQNGLSSRVAANIAVTDCPEIFSNLRGLRQWLHSSPVTSKQANPNWPTPETSEMWRSFVEGLNDPTSRKWKNQKFRSQVEWFDSIPPAETPVRLLYDPQNQTMRVHSINLQPLGKLPYTWEIEPSGVIVANVAADSSLSIVYCGPADLFS